MTHEVELIDQMDLPSLRAYATHQGRLIARLLEEREEHLSKVEIAFRLRHNAQVKKIERLEDKVASQAATLKTLRKAQPRKQAS